MLLSISVDAIPICLQNYLDFQCRTYKYVVIRNKYCFMVSITLMLCP